MSIKFAMLGCLSRQPMTGYDLKKRFAESDLLYWSGNSNQIYRSLVALHKDGLVTQTIEQQTDNPDRKIYTITDAGRAALREWVLTPPELPQVRHGFLIQLLWADQITPEALDDLLAAYAEELRVRLLMLEEQIARGAFLPAEGSDRQAQINRLITDRWTAYYQHEYDWVRAAREQLRSAPNPL